MLLGYRTWKAADVPGALKSNVEFIELSQVDVKALRR